MRVLRRRVAAMSPREKHLAILSALGLITLSFYYILGCLYFTLFVIVCCILWYYYGELLPTRFGLYPRAEFSVPVGLRRWLWGWGVPGVSAAQQKRTKSSKNKTEIREPESNFGVRFGGTRIYRRESETDSFLFSPRDFLMGSYIGKPESPPATSGRPRVARNPREQLREKLSRPNHAVYTPNRRLSFAGETPGALGRFTITPQRHYPLQQPGVSSVGVLPLVRWDGFRKKSILTPRNSPGVLSPVTVKIARPDHHSSPSVDHLSYAGLPKSPVDPCSRESVLKVLKETRKRNVEDEDRSFTAEQRNKRRRNDSGGSAHSAFEPLLPNGTPSQLVPKPGSLKRGMTSLMEESIMKRSRTSSISSGTGFQAPRGTPGTTRNPIYSSYSSTLGLSQRKRSAPSPTVSSPGSSRSQTPEGALKRMREEEGQSPSSASSVKSDQTVPEKTPVLSELTPVPKVPVTTSVDSTGSGGKRKRKIQLVPSHRDDNISLPPPPELGYTITVKDLDEEKKAAISKIQKILETPAPEPEKPSPDPALSQRSSSSSSTTTTILSSLLTAPLPTASTAAIPVINLDPSPAPSVGTAPAASTSLLEVLKMKSGSPLSSTSTVSTATVVTPASLAQPAGLKLNVSAVTPQLTPASQPQPSSAVVSLPSAFTQLPSQASVASSAALPAGNSGPFGLMGQSTAPAPSSTPVSAVASTSSGPASVSSKPLLASGFKPIFAVTPTATSSTMSTPEVKPSVQTFKPIFGSTTAGAGFQSPPIPAGNPASTLSSNITSSVFGSISSTTVAPSIFSSMTTTLTGTTSANSVATAQNANQPAIKSLFGSWTTPTTASTSSVPVLAPNAGSTFQFGSAATAATAAASALGPTAATTSSSNSTFAFGATQPDPQAAKQKVFAFGQGAPSQNTTGASFGGFSVASTAVATAASAAPSAFSFGKSSFQAPTTQSVFGSTTQTTFGSSASQPPKPFTFGGGGVSSTTPSNAAPPPFTFGAAAVTTTTSFVTPTKPAFGASSTGFSFGTSAATAAAAAAAAAPSAAPSFGASSQTQSATSGTFTFGGTPAQQTPSAPALAAPSGYNFGAAVPQFGTRVSNSPAPQMGSFNFGSAATDKPFGTSTPTFGQSAAPGPIPFGTPGQGFNSIPFGSSPTPSFSIGAGSKPSGARQRVPARRQHNRKK